MDYFFAPARLGSLLLSGLGLAACSVYVPLQGAAPAIRQKGELEVAAGWSLTNRLDAAATYSPLPHLLVRAAASTKGSRQSPADSSAYAHVSQYELALGTYWPLGGQVLVGALAGAGQAHADAFYRGDGRGLHPFLFGGQEPLHRFDGSYLKYTGELYAVWQPTPRLSFGASYRLVQVRLTHATDQGAPVVAGPSLRSEPMLCVRVRPNGPTGLVQLQLALGASRTLGYDQLTAADQADPARQYKLGQAYAMLGVALYPHVLGRPR